MLLALQLFEFLKEKSNFLQMMKNEAQENNGASFCFMEWLHGGMIYYMRCLAADFH